MIPAPFMIDHLSSGQGLLAELGRSFTLVETTPSDAEQAERRQLARYELQAGSVDVTVFHPDDSSSQALLTDVSAQGARVVADRLPSGGQIVHLVFDLGDRQMTLRCEVVRIGNDGAIRYFSVRFMDSPETPANPSG